MLLIFLVLIGYFTNELSSAAGTYGEVVESRLERRDRYDVEDAASLVRLHQDVIGRLPMTVAELTAFSKSIGQSFDESRVGFQYVPTVIGSLVRYERVILFVQKRGFATTESSFLAANTCGAGVTDDAGFCAPSGAFYSVIDTNARILSSIRAINFRINETYYKVTQTYDGRGVGFPNRRENGVLIPANTSVTLANFVGYTGTAANCRGTFKFSVMFLNCSDLFDNLGNPVIYHYRNPREIYLAVQTPFRDAAGNIINISRYARV